jgi:hypothetical protein
MPCCLGAPLTSPRHPRSDALDDHGPLELGKHPHHLKHGLAGRGRGVKPLLMQVKFDVTGVDLAQERDEILQRTPKPIDRPGHDDVEPAARGVAA